MDFLEQLRCDWSSDSLRLIATPSEAAKALLYYVQEVGSFQTRSGYFTERAHLNSFLVVHTVSGTGHLAYQGNHYTLCPGQTFFIDCMEHHSYKTDPEDLWEILWVHFNGSSSKGYFEQFIRQGTPIVTAGAAKAVSDILRRLTALHQKKDVRTELLSSQYITELLTELLLSGNALTPPNPLPDYIAATVNEIEKRFNEKITLDQLAAEYSVSKFYLSKEFKKYMGTPIHEYIIHARINRAKELLQYSSLPVAAIGESVGMEYTSHFISMFKARTGVTPLEFRKGWKMP